MVNIIFIVITLILIMVTGRYGLTAGRVGDSVVACGGFLHYYRLIVMIMVIMVMVIMTTMMDGFTITGFNKV